MEITVARVCAAAARARTHTPFKQWNGRLRRRWVVGATDGGSVLPPVSITVVDFTLEKKKRIPRRVAAARRVLCRSIIFLFSFFLFYGYYFAPVSPSPPGLAYVIGRIPQLTRSGLRIPRARLIHRAWRSDEAATYTQTHWSARTVPSDVVFVRAV